MPISKWIIIGFLVISILGFADASFLAVEHYRGEVPPCTIIKGCEKVINSEYSTIFNIPVALLGALYYLTIFLLTAAYLDTKNKKLLYFAAKLTLVGFLVSVALVYLQLFIIKSICFYCMLSALASTLLFILGIILLKSNQKHSHFSPKS